MSKLQSGRARRKQDTGPMKAFYFDQDGVKHTCTEAEWQAKFGNAGATFPARVLIEAAATRARQAKFNETRPPGKPPGK